MIGVASNGLDLVYDGFSSVPTDLSFNTLYGKNSNEKGVWPMEIGFIGLGNMGAGMAVNILAAGGVEVRIGEESE